MANPDRRRGMGPWAALTLLALLAPPVYGEDYSSNNDPSVPMRTIVAVGDIMLTGSAEPVLFQKGFAHPFGNRRLTDLIATADVAFANLEYPVALAGERYEDKTYVFKGRPETLAAVHNAGFNLLSLANNHIMDFGPSGLRSTLQNCKVRRLIPAGAGMDLREARRLKIFKKDGVRYGLLAYSLTYPTEFWATAHTAGTAYGDRAYLAEDIPRAARGVDILIVSFHWGEELNPIPKPYQIELAHLAVDLGASVVLGHHSHVPQPIEIYKDRPIFYSLGNYAFGSYSRNTPFSFVAEIQFVDTLPVRVKLHPIHVDNTTVLFQPRPAIGTAGDKIIDHLQEISAPFNTLIDQECTTGIIHIEGMKSSTPPTPLNLQGG